MYDLPSDKNPEEPGLDEFHLLQGQLLSETCLPPDYPPEQVFTALDLNLCYDIHHPLWYKRPDWFAVVGNDRLYDRRESRLSYVIWQEGVAPTIVVELLSPGTEKEDLGQTFRSVEQPPTKWEVYERILRIPYYVIYDRYKNIVRFFQLQGDRYVALNLAEPRLWMESLQLGIGLWQGSYRGITRLWLRWYDAKGAWIPCDRDRIEAERQRAERLMEQLRSLGVEPNLGEK